jgi:hypothetical protein
MRWKRWPTPLDLVRSAWGGLVRPRTEGEGSFSQERLE